MSWSSLGNKQIVTFENLLDGVNSGALTAKTGIPSSKEAITKADAFTYVNVDITNPSYANKTSNQLVTKNDIAGYSGRIYAINDTTTNYFKTPEYGTLMYSDDGGYNWTNDTSIYGFSVSRSGSGQYVLVSYTSTTLRVSNNYGSSYTTITLPSSPYSGYLCGTAMSTDGQYMFVITYGGNVINPLIYKSSDYGSTWTLAYQYVLGSSDYIEAPPYAKIDVSGNGQYVTAVINKQNSSFSWGARIIRSTNYGSTFSVSGDYTNRYWTDVAINSTGQYQLFTRMSSYGTGNTLGQGAINWSNNYGAGTSQKIYEEDMRPLYCSMSTSGQYMLVAFINNTDSVNKFYYSTNYGVSWSSFNTNPVPPYAGGMPGGVFVSPGGGYALITYVNRPEITYTTNFTNWYTTQISTSYTFGGMNKSK